MREKPYTKEDMEAMGIERDQLTKKQAEGWAQGEDDERKIIDGINITPPQEGEKTGESALKEGVLQEITGEGKIDRDDPEVQRMAEEMSFDELNSRYETERRYIDEEHPDEAKDAHLRRERQLKDAIILKVAMEKKAGLR